MTFDKIYNGVSVAGVNVGGMDTGEAAQAIREAIDERALYILRVKIAGEYVEINGEDMMNSADVDTAAVAAFNVARDGSPQGTDTLSEPVELPLPLYEKSPIWQKLTEKAQELNAEKIDFSYKIEGDQLGITVGANGECVDVDALCAQVADSFMKRGGDVEAELISFEAKPLDLDAVYKKIHVDPVDAYYDLETLKVVEGKPGYDFDLEAVKKKLKDGTPGKTYWFPLQVTEPGVSYDDVSASFYKDVLYEYTTYLTDIPNRTNNVVLAAAAINGTVLNPGDEFDFDAIVGERTEAKGYRAADVYVNSDTVKEVGGGICQVASTIYVCTLYCDLKITERWEHTFFVTYVPAGLDATIYWGSCNYRFVNDKNYPILIETETEGLSLTVRFKGTKENDNYVQMVSETVSTDPFQEITEVDNSKSPGYESVKTTGYTGRYVVTTRNVYSGDGTLISSTHEADSNYRRRDRVVVVGPSSQPSEPSQSEEPTPSPSAEPVPPLETDVPSPEPVEPTPEPTPIEPVFEEPPFDEDDVYEEPGQQDDEPVPDEGGGDEGGEE